jgi:hypothetical protein
MDAARSVKKARPSGCRPIDGAACLMQVKDLRGLVEPFRRVMCGGVGLHFEVDGHQISALGIAVGGTHALRTRIMAAAGSSAPRAHGTIAATKLLNCIRHARADARVRFDLMPQGIGGCKIELIIPTVGPQGLTYQFEGTPGDVGPELDAEALDFVDKCSLHTPLLVAMEPLLQFALTADEADCLECSMSLDREQGLFVARCQGTRKPTRRPAASDDLFTAELRLPVDQFALAAALPAKPFALAATALRLPLPFLADALASMDSSGPSEAIAARTVGIRFCPWGLLLRRRTEQGIDMEVSILAIPS